MSFDHIRYFIAFFLWILTWCIAFWRGRWPERSFAGATIVLSIAQPLVQQVKGGGYAFDWGLTAVDIALFATLIFLAVRSGRLWPIVASGFQLVSVINHFAIFVHRPTSQFVHLSVGVIMGYLVLFVFQAGLVENELRRRAEARLAASQPPEESQ